MVSERMGAQQTTLAEAVRQACIKTALAAYEDAAMNGLCHEGAWECAVEAMRALDVTVIIRQSQALSSGRAQC